MNFEAVATRPEKHDAFLPPAPPKTGCFGIVIACPAGITVTSCCAWTL